jgi:hypothetical protein
LPATAFPLGLDAADGHGRRRRPTRSRPRLLAAFAAGAAAAGLAAWLILGAFPASPGGQPNSPPATHTPAVPTVDVNADAEVGQPVDQVSQALTQLGLTPQIVFVTNSGQDPGTVISVQPAGPVPIGSIVTVTAAQQGKHDGGQGNG